MAVVASLHLDLEKGMSVLTGETGAGKSILLTALSLALGDRADAGYIRPGSKRAEINLQFALDDASPAKIWLQEQELDDGEHCLIRRVISRDGPSKAFINNRPVTLQALQALSEKLVEIHGQHAHLSLLESDQQRRLLDDYGKHQILLADLNRIYQNWDGAQRELHRLQQAGHDRAEREELLTYQLNELQQLDLNAFNYRELADEHTKLANLGEILSGGQAQLDLLYENDAQSLSHMLAYSAHVLHDLAKLAPELNAIAGMLSEAQIQVQEAAQELRRFLEAQEADPQRLLWLETQMGVVHALSRKHQSAPEQLPELANALARELDAITHGGERIEELHAAVAQLQQQYRQLAAALSAQRVQAASALQRQISAMIRELGMPQGDFKIAVTPLSDAQPKLNGVDKIEFRVSANPGLPPRPLAKVASGGELSRISLAIQVATGSDKTVPTMIFDEVDTGIGGGIAEMVGKRLRDLSSKRQVLCVTHLPQVACQAHQHLFVEKTGGESQMTASTVRPLDTAQRTEEIARMLGGLNITENTLAHAREMLTMGNPEQ
jgi:DNA repair protein RecN (Recombination protein N)